MIKRELYLKKIKKFQDKPLIKVITGMRRAGKSTLLNMLAEDLKEQGIRDEQIVRINFESMDFDVIRDYRQLYAYIKEKLIPEAMYLLLDEIQQVDSWERAINSLFMEGGVDIYITGSNANMLSSDLSTLLAGRYVEIQVFPLSFQEYLLFLPQEVRENKSEAFENYMKYGGLPLIPSLPQENDTMEMFLAGIYNTVLMKDVIQRNAVRDPALLENIVRFLADNVGNPVSSSKVAGYLTSQGRKTAAATVDNYLQMLTKAYIFYRAQRYDIKGKMYLKTQEKYYIVDNGLRNALLDFRQGDYGHVLENIVYLELLRRGYHVAIGKVGTLEVDFVASKAERKVYYQVAASVLDDATRERELKPLEAIPDAYEKVLLTMDRTFIRDFEGIRNINIVDWLLEEDGYIS